MTDYVCGCMTCLHMVLITGSCGLPALPEWSWITCTLCRLLSAANLMKLIWYYLHRYYLNLSCYWTCLFAYKYLMLWLNFKMLVPKLSPVLVHIMGMFYFIICSSLTHTVTAMLCSDVQQLFECISIQHYVFYN